VPHKGAADDISARPGVGGFSIPRTMYYVVYVTEVEAEHGAVYFLTEHDALVLYGEGDIQAVLAYSMFAHVQELLASGTVKRVYLDLSRTQYIDSTTIGTFLKLYRVLSQRGGALQICNPSEPVRRILRTCHLEDYLPIRTKPALVELRSEVIDRLPVQTKEELSKQYVLDVHRDIVNTVPELTPKFSSLIRTLERSLGEDEE